MHWKLVIKMAWLKNLAADNLTLFLSSTKASEII
jgi:hypothetical protein